MKNLKIGIRLGLGFLLVVSLMVVVAAIGTIRLGTMNHDTGVIVNDRAPKLVTLHNIISDVNGVAIATRNILMMSDPAQIKKEQDSIANARKTITEGMGIMEKSLNTPQGRELFKTVTEARQKYVDMLNVLLKLTNEGKKDEAFRLLLNDMRTAQIAYLETLDKLIDYVTEVLRAAGIEADATYKSARTLMLGLTAAAIVLSLIIAMAVSGSITRPINEAVRIAQTIAGGDLTTRIESKSKDETGQLLTAMKTMNDNLHQVCSQVRSGTATIATASSQIANGNQDLSSRTEEQAGSLQQTASSMEQLTSTVRQNAENAHQANQLSMTASEIAAKGGEVVSQVVETMGAINESSKKMADIINVIDGIAFQTNILALNAAVEAARAGEQGRGFAVVATEVRNLAQRSASAAREIKSLIDDSVTKVESGSKLVEHAGVTIQEVVSSVRRVNDIMSEITAASREQSEGIEQINQAVVQMDQVTQQNAALVEEAAAAAESLQEQANHLTNVVAAFKTGAHASETPASAQAKATPRAATAKAEKGSTSAPRRQMALAGAGGADWEEF